jgi:hypothetical protein
VGELMMLDAGDRLGARVDADCSSFLACIWFLLNFVYDSMLYGELYGDSVLYTLFMVMHGCFVLSLLNAVIQSCLPFCVVYYYCSKFSFLNKNCSFYLPDSACS